MPDLRRHPQVGHDLVRPGARPRRPAPGRAGGADADLLLAVGTTLTVYPVANVPLIAQRAGARVVIVNAEPTAFDSSADAVLRGPIADILPVVCGSEDLSARRNSRRWTNC